MMVLGIDPGSLCTGYGIVQADAGRMRALACGVIRLRPQWDHVRRIGVIVAELDALISEFGPGGLALEGAFVNRNPQSALKLGQVRGAVIALAASRTIPLNEYAPKEVKLAVAGTGSASKERLALMVASRLGLGEIPRPLDATDALAIAVCDLQRSASPVPQARRRSAPDGGGWSNFVRDYPDLVVRSI